MSLDFLVLHPIRVKVGEIHSTRDIPFSLQLQEIIEFCIRPMFSSDRIPSLCFGKKFMSDIHFPLQILWYIKSVYIEILLTTSSQPPIQPPIWRAHLSFAKLSDLHHCTASTIDVPGFLITISDSLVMKIVSPALLCRNIL